MDHRIGKKFALSILVAAIWIFLYAAYLETHKDEFEKADRLAALLSAPAQESPAKEAALEARNKEADCRVQGPLPDPDCTPGAIFPDATVEEICVHGYSKTVRNVSNKLKQKVFAQYGIAYPQPFGSYEIDHLVPLSLGGSNDIANLWPKSAKPFPGFHEKNVAGYYLREEVCLSRVALSVAQAQIAKNWFAIYAAMPLQKIEELKEKYPSWADRKK